MERVIPAGNAWDRLTPGQRRFLELLDRELARLDPPLPAACEAALEGRDRRPGEVLKVVIRHREDGRLDLGVTVEAGPQGWGEAIASVGDGYAHEHFDREGYRDEGPDGWREAAVAPVGRPLPGRGRVPVAVRGRPRGLVPRAPQPHPVAAPPGPGACGG